MAIDKKDLYSQRMSDVMRLIDSTNKRVEEASETERVQTTAEPVQKKKTGRPKAEVARNKRVTLYLTEREYAIVKEYAYRKRVKLNSFIVERVMENLGPLPKLRDTFNEEIDGTLDKKDELTWNDVFGRGRFKAEEKRKAAAEAEAKRKATEEKEDTQE